MNKDQAEAMLQALGSKNSGGNENWVRGPCPLAPYTHKSGKDSSPSFGLNIEQGTVGRFHCFTCESGSLSKLLQLIEFHAQLKPGFFKGDMAKAREIVANEEVDLPVLPAYSEFGYHSKTKAFQHLPDYWLESWKPAWQCPRSIAYLEHRKISLQQAQQFDLRFDPMFDRLVFPYRDVFGRLAGARGRGIWLPGEPEKYNVHHDYVWNDVNNAAITWYNEQQLDQNQPIVVVEGQFDVLRVAQVYPHVMGNLTAKPVLAKMTKLAQASGVILMLDGDKPGRDATKKFADFLDILKVPTAVILLPTEDDEGKEIKTDPDKLGVNYIAQALKNIGLDIDIP